MLLKTIQRLFKRVLTDEQGALPRNCERSSRPNSAKSLKRARLAQAQKRYEEISTLVQGLYENFASQIIPERQYRQLMTKYDREQAELETKIGELEAALSRQQQKPLDIDAFLAIIRKYKYPTELTDTMLSRACGQDRRL